MCPSSYNLEKERSRESENGTAKQMANKGQREEAEGKWKRLGEQLVKGWEGGQ